MSATATMYAQVRAQGTLLAAKRSRSATRITLGYRGRHSPHSWRSAFSTLAHDAGMDHMAIESQLDHVIPGVAGVYDRGQRLEMRRDLMEWWESQLTIDTV